MIDDLPESDYSDDRTNQMANMTNNLNVNLDRNLDQPRNINSNVTGSIHKKPRNNYENLSQDNDKSYYDMYVTKENILLLIILYIACLRQSDEYTRKFLINIPFNLAHNSFASTIIKCVIILIIYLIVKQHI